MAAPRSLGRMLGGFVLGMGLLALPAPARALGGGSSARAPAARSRVLVGIPRGDALHRPGILAGALASHLQDTPFEAEVVDLPAGDVLANLTWAEGFAGDDSALHAVLWIEPGLAGSYQLYLFQPASGRAWVRALPMTSEPEVAAESLGVMIRALAMGLGDGEPAGMQAVPRGSSPAEPAAAADRSDEPSDPEPPEAPPPRPWRPHLHAAVGYRGGSVANALPWHSGLEVRAGLRFEAGMFINAGFGWSPVARSTRRATGLALDRLGFDLRAGFQFRPHPRAHPQVDLTVIGDVIRWRSAPPIPPGTEDRGEALRLGVAPGAGLLVPIWGGFALRVHAQADLWLRNAEFVVQTPDRPEVLLRGHDIAARIDAGLWVGF